MKPNAFCTRSLLSRPFRVLAWSISPAALVGKWIGGLIVMLATAAGLSGQVISNDCLTVTCPPDLVTNYTCSDVFVPQQYPVIVSNRCPGLAYQVNCTPPAGTPLGLGAHPIDCVVVAGGTVVAQCHFTILVLRDTVPPVITCPSNIVVHTCPNAAGGCSATVNYTGLTATDNSGQVAITCAPSSGSVFPCGISTVNCRAEDRCGNKDECTFQVEVRDDGNPPTIRCPQDITVLTCGDCQVVNYPAPVVVDGVLVGCQPPSGTCFPLGVTTVLCQAVNDCGSAECKFDIIVRPVPPPVIQCPSNIVATVPCGSNCVPVIYPDPVVVSGTLVGCVPPSGSCLPVGVHLVSCRATNICGKVAGCEFEVQVIPGQGEPPQITCPSNIVVSTCSNCTPVHYPAPVVNNGVLVGCNPPPTFCFPLGLTPVTCLATNPCGSATCTFTVTVRPVPPVSIQCPTNPIVATVPCGSNCVPVFYPDPPVLNGALIGCNPPSGACLPVGNYFVICRASNECGTVGCEFPVNVIQGQGEPPVIRCPQDITVFTCNDCRPVNYPAPVVVNGLLVGCNPPPTFCFPLGTTSVNCVATNECGSAECKFTITVRPVPPPVIECPSNIVATVPCTSNCVPVNYPAPVVTGGDLVGCNPPSGTCLPVGLHLVTCRATNECGEVVGCEFQIRVIQGQGEPPRIDCPTNIVVTTCGNCEVVNYPAPGVINGVLVGCTPPSGSCFPLGVNGVNCIASNGCGQVECVFTITVRPVPPPTIQCPTNPIVLTIPCNSNCVPLSYPSPGVSGGTLVGCNPPPGTCLPSGVYVVICRATNECGQVAGCEFDVRIVPGQGEPPIIHCPEDITVTTCTNCQAVPYPAPVVLNGVLAGCNPPPTFCFPLGTTSVNCVATNECGSAECKFTVTVRPVPPLDIVCPSNIVVTTCGTNEVVQYPPPTVIGSTDPADYNVICQPPSGSVFPIGTNRVVCCVVDRCDRTKCCEFTITVVHRIPCVKPPLNMVLWLPFDELVGPLANNIIAGAPDGWHVNGPVPFLGQHVLNSLRFDGVNDFVRVPNYSAIQMGVQNFSIDCWALRRDTDGGRRVIVSKISQVAGGIAGYEFYLNNGVMNLALRTVLGTFNFNSGVPVPLDNQWHHLAVTVQRIGAGQARFYLDGAPVAVIAGGVPGSVNNFASLYVGAGTWPVPNGFFRGFLDELEIFRRILTAAEVNALWQADRAGKCKIRCAIPWDVSFPAGVNCITVQARICNDTAVPLPVSWVASGPMPIPTPSGNLVIPPFSCVNVPITLCRPTNNVLVGSIVRWTLSVFSDNNCPLVCTGSVINPGHIIVTVPTDIVQIPGTNRPGLVRVGVTGLPAGQLLRLRAIGPDMEPDLSTISLNGLPPGTPLFLGDGSVKQGGVGEFEVAVRFVEADPVGLYTILAEVDVTGDGEFDTLASFDVENPVVPPPTITIVDSKEGKALDWKDEGEGLGLLESAKTVEGEWKVIPGALPGYLLNPTEPMQFFRVVVPGE